MQVFDRQTKRLYYEEMYLRRASASIVKMGDDFIELDATIAYPEGGGQEADTGVITARDGTTLRFVGAKKLFGRMIFLDDFPNIQVEGIVRHLIHPQDIPELNKLSIGAAVDISIDVERRASLSLSHTASHLLYVGIGTIRPDAIPGTLGCHIKTNSARFDFSIKERFTEAQLKEIADVANQMVQRNSSVTLYPHNAEPDARYWKCEEQIIPCGGTHIDSAGPVGSLILRRKSLGAGKERITCEFPNADLRLDQYYS